MGKLKSIKVSNDIARTNTGTEVIAKMMSVDEVPVNPELEGIFSKDEKVVQDIIESMKKDGFHEEEPIVIARTADGEVLGVADGYTRLHCAKAVGIKRVPVTYRTVDDLDDAADYTKGRQKKRRNLSQADLLRLAGELQPEEEKDGTGRASEKLAEQLGVSASTIEHARAVAKHADDETKEKIKKGEMSVNKAYQDKVRKKKTKQQDDDTEDDISESLSEGNKGNPGGLNFNHSDGHERPAISPSAGTDMDARLIERYKEGHADGIREGFEKGVSDGAYEVWQRIVEMMRDGLTADEIESSEVFADFTYSVIAPKLGIKHKKEAV